MGEDPDAAGRVSVAHCGWATFQGWARLATWAWLGLAFKGGDLSRVGEASDAATADVPKML